MNWVQFIRGRAAGCSDARILARYSKPASNKDGSPSETLIAIKAAKRAGRIDSDSYLTLTEALDVMRELYFLSERRLSYGGVATEGWHTLTQGSRMRADIKPHQRGDDTNVGPRAVVDIDY